MYLGISCTGHDNAIALVNEQGKVLYAQAAERDFQSKQAFSLAADSPHKVMQLISRFAPGCKEVTVCKSWPEDTDQRQSQEIFKISIDDFPDQAKFVAGMYLQAQLNNKDSIFLPNIAMAGGGTERAAQALGFKTRTKQFDHHSTHAAFACYSSPFEEAACLVVDGYSEDSAQSIYVYKNNQLEKLALPEYKGSFNRLAASLGVYYGVTVCLLCGFAPDSGEEWKIMGLAPYGKVDHELLSVLKRYITVEDGQLVLPHSSPEAIGQIMSMTCGYYDNPDRCADLAHTAQYYFAELMSAVLTHIHELTGLDNLVLTGGCALNSAYNGKITAMTPFKNVYIPSAPGDDGNAIGAALLALKADKPDFIINNAFQSPYLGDEISPDEVLNFVEKSGLTNAQHFEYQDLYPHIAKKMAQGKVIAWVQGRAEFGSRALGNRSIICDPRSFAMKAKINAAVKFREPFRPFAPVILHERGEEYFENYSDTPYMEKVLTFKEEKRSQLQAVCHNDNTGRLQSVTKERNEHLYNLVKAFDTETGVPVILNTSLNVMGKPIVSSMNDAVMTFMTTDIDILVIGQYVFHKHSA